MTRHRNISFVTISQKRSHNSRRTTQTYPAPIQMIYAWVFRQYKNMNMHLIIEEEKMKKKKIWKPLMANRLKRALWWPICVVADCFESIWILNGKLDALCTFSMHSKSYPARKNNTPLPYIDYASKCEICGRLKRIWRHPFRISGKIKKIIIANCADKTTHTANAHKRCKERSKKQGTHFSLSFSLKYVLFRQNSRDPYCYEYMHSQHLRQLT